MKANCLLLAAKPAQVPAPITLRISNGRPVKAEPPKAHGRAFQLTAEEERVAADVVAGMFLSLSHLLYLLFCLSHVHVIRYVFSELISYICFI